MGRTNFGKRLSNYYRIGFHQRLGSFGLHWEIHAARRSEILLDNE
jgi:hypothetical protein